jgi:hypothetical protein
MDNSTTGVLGVTDLGNMIFRMNWTAAQSVAAQRITFYFARSDTYTNVYGSGGSALLFSSNINVLEAPAPPFDQWRVEVESWFQTGLAKMQAYAVEYVNVTADLGPDGNVGFPDTKGGLGDAWVEQCRNQKIRNTGSFQTFSYFGVVFTFTVGSFIIVLGWNFERVFTIARKIVFSFIGRNGRQFSPRQRAWVADGNLETQRMLFEILGYGKWENCDEEYPWCSDGTMIPNVEDGIRTPNAESDNKEHYFFYPSNGAPSNGTVQPATGTTTNSAPSGPTMSGGRGSGNATPVPVAQQGSHNTLTSQISNEGSLNTAQMETIQPGNSSSSPPQICRPDTQVAMATEAYQHGSQSNPPSPVHQDGNQNSPTPPITHEGNLDTSSAASTNEMTENAESASP